MRAAKALTAFILAEEDIVRHDNVYWIRFAVVTATTAAVTATLLNIGSAIAADVSAGTHKLSRQEARAADIVGKPSIHNMVMDELTGAEPLDSLTRIKNPGSVRGGTDPANDVPTSMLWPAYKYLPQLSNVAWG